jgi:hypothetical protein
LWELAQRRVEFLSKLLKTPAYFAAPVRFVGVFQCLKVIFQQFHDQCFVARATSWVAINAADQELSVVIDFDDGASAVRALHGQRDLS